VLQRQVANPNLAAAEQLRDDIQAAVQAGHIRADTVFTNAAAAPSTATEVTFPSFFIVTSEHTVDVRAEPMTNASIVRTINPVSDSARLTESPVRYSPYRATASTC
jgi:hypothetical protein